MRSSERVGMGVVTSAWAWASACYERVNAGMGKGTGIGTIERAWASAW
ncbi:MAG: hypothetical protein AAGE52_26905 [Myxococcota bacterium]